MSFSFCLFWKTSFGNKGGLEFAGEFKFVWESELAWKSEFEGEFELAWKSEFVGEFELTWESEFVGKYVLVVSPLSVVNPGLTGLSDERRW